MILYILSFYLLLAHKSVTDARLWYFKKVNGFLATDKFYLGGSFITVSLSVISAFLYAKQVTLLTFLLVTASNFLIGSVLWDIVYGIICYNDAFYPYKNWYDGYGFKDKKQRVIFDSARLILGVILMCAN